MRAVSDRLTQKTRTMRASVHNSMFCSQVFVMREHPPSLPFRRLDGVDGGCKKRRGCVCCAAVLAMCGWMLGGSCPGLGWSDRKRKSCANSAPPSRPRAYARTAECLDLCLWHRPEVRFPARVPLDAVSDTDPFRLPQVSAVPILRDLRLGPLAI